MTASPDQPYGVTDSLPPPDMPRFERTRSGYHTGQVHTYVARLLEHIRELEHGHSPQGEAMLADLIKAAGDELTGKKDAAAAEAADILRRATQEAETKLSGATQQATSVIAAAEQEAQKIVAGAREQADTALATAHGQAKQIVDKASVHAASVDEGARRRLGNMVAHHVETRRRLQEICDVTANVLKVDENRGTLPEEVDRAQAAIVGDPEALGALPEPDEPKALPPSEPSATEGVVDDSPADDAGTAVEPGAEPTSLA